MNGKSCFFIGHRDTPAEIYPALYVAIEDHIANYGVMVLENLLSAITEVLTGLLLPLLKQQNEFIRM